MSLSLQAETVRFATFNVSMEGGNYVERGEQPTGKELFKLLENGNHSQIRNIAHIIQLVRPDVLLLNEFDYTLDPSKGVEAFQKHYLSRSQKGAKEISYPYYYVSTVNTGVPTGFDLDRDGNASGKGADAYGFGLYPGQYGMVLLSAYPIDQEHIRSFQHFLWKDMPDNQMDKTRQADGSPWYSSQAREGLRLSSKSHWDIPLEIDGKTVHVLASHPTPPAFDGAEKRNVKRNADELRFWQDYLTEANSNYIYDDQGHSGGFAGERFVIMGDLNASIDEGSGDVSGIGGLLSHPSVSGRYTPVSEGGKAHKPDNPFAPAHTAFWGMRADYVLPSEFGFNIEGGGVFWPKEQDPLFYLIKDRASSSDHRLVWLDLDVLK